MRNHVGAIIGIAVGLILTLVVSLTPGCVRTDSIVNPGKKVTAAQLQQEAVTIQQDLDNEATTIQQKIQSDQTNDSKLVADYNAKVQADQSKLANASTDLQNKLANLQSIFNVIGGITNTVLNGASNPSSIIGSGLTLVLGGLATGSFLDSTKKQTAITSLRNSLSSPPPATSGPNPTNPGAASAPFVVAAPAPNNPVVFTKAA